MNEDIRIIGLTASPGWNLERIKEVVENLFIEKIEVRSGKEKDIVKYIPKIDIEEQVVELDEKIQQIRDLLNKAIELRIQKLGEILPSVEIKKGKKDILEWIDELKKQLEISPRDQNLRSGIIILSELLKIYHALEVLETQTLYTFIEYFNELQNEIRKSKADYQILEDIRIKKAIYLAKEFIKNGYEHPKIYKLLEILKENKDKKIIVFAQIRKTLDRIKEFLDKEGFSSAKFVGKKEMNQSEQIKLLKQFAEGKFNILLATSVGEEGIDIPKVDLVIFYEPVPSEIRYIQRRGRTGRGEFGKVIILVTKNSIDEKFYWVAINKERKMLRLIKMLKKYMEKDNIEIKTENNSNNYNEKKIEEKKEVFIENKYNTKDSGIMKYFNPSPQDTSTNKNVPIIIVDYKEKDSGVVQILAERDVLIRLENLDVGDYIVGDFIIERKSIIDFINSILDGRLYSQLEKLQNKNSLLIIEGEEEELILSPEFSANYLRSLILKIILEYKIPIIRTRNFIDTANYIYLIAKSSFKVTKIPEGVKTYKSFDEIKLEILKQIPGIGEILAKKLLKRFKSLKGVFTASKVELSNVIGEQRAEKLKRIFEEEYKGE